MGGVGFLKEFNKVIPVANGGCAVSFEPVAGFEGCAGIFEAVENDGTSLIGFVFGVGLPAVLFGLSEGEVLSNDSGIGMLGA